MGNLPEQAAWFMKLAICLLPMVAGCLTAHTLAERRQMGLPRRAWKVLSAAFAVAMGTAVLAGLVIWAIA